MVLNYSDEHCPCVGQCLLITIVQLKMKKMENKEIKKQTVNAVGMTAKEEQEVQFLINTIGGFTRAQVESRLAKRYGVKIEDLKNWFSKPTIAI